MKKYVFFLLASVFLTVTNNLSAQGTAFTYQGRLNSGGVPAGGNFDFTFALFNNSNTDNGQIGATLTETNVGVTNGLFVVTVDFGGAAFNGNAVWLEIAVRPSGNGSFFTLVPRQSITTSPYSIYAGEAGNVTGAISLSQLPSAVITNNATNETLSGNFFGNFGGSFFGNGSGLAGVNYTGGIVDSQLSANIPRLNGTNVFIGSNVFAGGVLATNGSNLLGGNFLGAFIGNGFGLSNLNISQFTSPIVTNAQTNVTLNGAFTGSFGGSGAGLTNVNAFSLNGVGASGFWQLGGNTVASGQFMGSTNNQPVEIWVGGARALRLEPGAGGAPNVIAGSLNNFVSNGIVGASIGGGGATNYSGFSYTNIVGGIFGTVGGGVDNVASGSYSTVGGGSGNNASGFVAAIMGGGNNTASNNFATIGGGNLNNAQGLFSTIPGGNNNTASGNYSFAAGDLAQATNAGAFVWADNQGTPFISTSNNQFNVRAAGGVRFVTSGAGMTIDGNPVFASGNGLGLTIQQNNAGAPNMILGSSANYVGNGVVGAAIGGGGAINFNGVTYSNGVTGSFGTIGGGQQNLAENSYTTIGGGSSNTIIGQYGAIAGGQQNSASGLRSFVGGGWLNLASATESTVVAGYNNTASGPGSFVGGGGFDGSTLAGNTAGGAASVVGGGVGNSANFAGAVVAGGGTDGSSFQPNVAGGAASTVGGGLGNTNTVAYGTIAGGRNNSSQASYTAVGGGFSNSVAGSYGTVAGGQQNLAFGPRSTVAGGWLNSAGMPEATVVGGYSNNASGYGSFIGGGGYDGSTLAGNTASGNASVVSGGLNNSASGTGATIGGGGSDGFTPMANIATGIASTIGGGLGNTNFSPYGTIAGGWQNSINNGDVTIGGGFSNNAIGAFGTIAGGEQNSAAGLRSVVTGGWLNSAGSTEATVSGGVSNTASGSGSFVGGGGFNGTTIFGNTASGGASVVTGGFENYASGIYSAIGGGYDNIAALQDAVVAGGVSNVANNSWSTVGGGAINNANGLYSTVPGGYLNTAAGEYSFAAGYQANAQFLGCFVWADSQGTPFSSMANNQFLIRAAGGVGINTNSPQQALSVNGGVNIDQGSQNTGTTGNALTFGSNSGEGVGSIRTNGFGDSFSLNFYTDFSKRMTILQNGNVGIATTNATQLLVVGAGGAYCNGSLWVNSSDRNLKHGFHPVDTREVLDKISAMPVTEWGYDAEPGGIKHIGPMAQDFHAAFGLNGSDDKHISTVDEGGVALAAIQGLNQKVDEKDAEIQTLKKQNDAMAARLSELEAAVKALAVNK